MLFKVFGLTMLRMKDILLYDSHVMSLFQLLEAGEMLHVAEAFIDKNYHPTVICRGETIDTYIVVHIDI